MNRFDLFLAVVGVALATGCASVERPAATSDDEAIYLTGSHIPARSGIASPNVKATSNKHDIDEMLNRGGNATGGVLGAGGS